MPAPIESLDRPTLERRYRRMRLATGILGVVSLLLVGALSTQGLRGSASETPQDAAPGQTQDTTTAGDDTVTPGNTAQNCPVVDRRDASDTRALGDFDAPVVLHEWTDFRCPYCGAFSRDTLPVLIEEYVETGKVRLEIHDAALVGGDNSVLIAVAARAAGEQGKYFEFFDAIYAAFETRPDSKAEYSVEELTAVAEAVGVADLTQFASDLEREDLRAGVVQETADAQSIGVTGVPFFATTDCGKVTSGAQPVDAFRTMLDEEVARATQRAK